MFQKCGNEGNDFVFGRRYPSKMWEEGSKVIHIFGQIDLDEEK
jgi:hypothetical protein